MTGLAWMAWWAGTAAAQQPAFPGAEGWAGTLTGGRGGAVLVVDTLAASGPGSLQWAVSQPGPRIVVFAVSGVIEGDVQIPHGDLTVLGQTAPGAGITIHGHLYTDYGTPFGNLVLRHLRVRAPLPDANWIPAGHDTVQFSTNNGILLDHMDLSHGVDETLDLWGGAQDITIQWSAITFPVYGAGHPDGDEHNYGMINGPGGGRISVHHTLFAHAKTRTPALSAGPADVRNNVVYNGREGFVHHNPATGDFNIVGNTYRDGPSADLFPFWFDPENPNPPTQYWLQDNQVDDPGVYTGTLDNPFDDAAFASSYGFFCCGITPGHFDVPAAFDWSADPAYVPVTTQPNADAYEDVLDCAGAWPRDVVNTWAVDDTRNRTGSYGDIRPADWLEGLTPGTPPPDGDVDGLPDAWETKAGLDPSDASDAGAIQASGYAAIEDYANELAATLDPCVPEPTTPSGPTPPTDTGTDTPPGPTTPPPTGSTPTGDAGDGESDDAQSGCGCSSPGPGAALAWLLPLALVRRRTP